MVDADREYCSACGTIWLKMEGHKCPGPGVGYATPTAKALLDPDVAIHPAEMPGNPINPSHYVSGGIELIDYLQAKLTPEEFRGYLKGQIFKYTTRLGHKGPAATDAKKCHWYATRLAQFEESE